ncbi:putative NADH:ubiquinone reductase (H(+)-translocating) [Lupinus albus]|uniref:NAD(P)H-quinone oxidoreductase subunit 6, chloroplastic n=1 Tax=Lupinus albus TaxID=3870 RepID=A0A6A4PS74_LUPAL|nr:putative NADH:ubiquinone reductase (H(+)-translocating) [Lupinus albus]
MVLVFIYLFYILSNSHFVAATQLLIYMGAINTLTIFVVMLMNSEKYYPRLSSFDGWKWNNGINLMACTSI